MGNYIFIAICWLSIIASVAAQQSYTLPATREAVEGSREELLNSVGIKEVGGNNKGKDIDRILAPFGLKAVAWCQAFQYYCFYVTGEPIPIKKTAGSQACFNDAKKRGTKVPYRAEVDALLIFRTVNSWTGHSARIINLGKMGWVQTIEGNTSNGINVRDGEGVYIRKRHLQNPIGKLRVMGTILFNIIDDDSNISK